MANTKISDLPSTTTLTNEDAIPVVQEGVTKKFTGVLVALKTLLGIGEPSKLQTQSKEVVGAVNELNGKTESTFTIDPSSGVISRGTQKVRKTSHAMSVTMTFSVSGQISEPITIATLPEGFRPSRSISKFIALGSATSVFNITVAGKILIGYMSAPVDEGSYLVVDETILI